ncbi:MAG: hypothetical protein HDT19_02015 [Oscillibacter sp.]|nr:hypothetical protein [Oscillibacter sp.]
MDWMGEALGKYGQRVLIRRQDGEAEARAFFQPLPERGEQVPQNPTSLGWADKRLWLYLGREELAPGDAVVWEERTFRVRSVRPYHVGEHLHHYQAFLEAAKEAAEE